jgi:RNA polymerase sigma-70 factor (ECF subfamily)
MMVARAMNESASRPRPVVVDGGAATGADRRAPDEALDLRERLRVAFRAHSGGVYATAHRILGDASDAEDVTQTVFETLARRVDTLRDEARLGAFLKTCAVRECLMLLRRRRWWRGRRGQRALTPVALESGPSEPFLVAAVRELLAPLSAEERIAVVLKLVEEHSHEEVAALMGISVATARRRLASARGRMLERARDDVQRRLLDEIEVPS